MNTLMADLAALGFTLGFGGCTFWTDWRLRQEGLIEIDKALLFVGRLVSLFLAAVCFARFFGLTASLIMGLNHG
jgi:hypothetical protein